MRRIFTLFVPMIFLSWLSYAQPGTQASAITFTPVSNQTGQMIIGWTSGTGTNKVIVMVSSGTTTGFTPSNNTTYNPNTTFGGGTNYTLGGGTVTCVFNAVSSTGPVTVSGLSAGTVYFVRIYEYASTDAPGAETYNKNSAASNPLTFEYYTSSTAWTTPIRVSTGTVQAWGGGASGGGNNTTADGGGGGGGGAYTKGTGISLTGNPAIAVAATKAANSGASGSDGDDTTFGSTTVVAKGGKLGSSAGAGRAGGAGGAGASCTPAGTTGGTGGNGRSNSTGRGGGGGSSAGTVAFNTSEDGGNGGSSAGTAGSITGGGSGGVGGDTGADGNPGFFPGGGGGGSGDGNPKTGGTGAGGLLILSYAKAAPTISVAQMTSTSTGIAKIGDVITIRVTVSPAETGLVSAGSTINSKTPSFSDAGSGNYDFTYTVASNDNDWAAGALPFSIKLADGQGNTSAAQTSFTVANTRAGDGHAPVISNVAISPSSGTAKIGDVITFTLTAGETLLTNNGSTINTKTPNTFVDNANNTYTVTYNVASGDTDWGSGSLPMSFVVKDAAGNSSAAVTSTTVANTLAGDANAPTNQNTVFASSATTAGGNAVTIASSGTASNEVWFAPTGTTVTAYTDLTALTAGNFSKNTNGTLTSLNAPANAGTYYLYVVDAAKNVSAASTAILTVDNTPPAAFSITSVNGFGGTVVSNYFNGTNTSIKVVIPIDGSDATLTGGHIKLQVQNLANAGYVDIQNNTNIAIGTNPQTITVTAADLTASFVTTTGYANNQTLQIKVTIYDKAGNSTANTTSSTLGVDEIKADTSAPNAFTVGAVAAVTGTAVPGYFNISNHNGGAGSGITISVPTADADDNSIQILVDNQAAGGFVPVGGSTSVSGNPTSVPVNDAALTGSAKYADGNTLSFKAILTDNAGNSTTGTVSATTLKIDQTAPTLSPNTMTLFTRTTNPEKIVFTFSEPLSTPTTSNAVTGFDTSVPTTVANATYTEASPGVCPCTITLTSVADGDWTTGTTVSYTTSNNVSDAAHNELATVTTHAVVLETSPPVIQSVSIPNSPMKVGSTVTVTITTADDDGDSPTLTSGTIGGFTLVATDMTSSTTSKTATFTVTEAGTDVAAASNIPVANLVLTDADGNASSIYSTPIVQANDAIDANSPTITSITNSVNPIYEGALTQTVTVVYSETMKNTIQPTITLNGAGSNWGAQTASGGTNGWVGNTYTATFTHNATQETISGITTSVGVAGAQDAAGNPNLGTKTSTAFNLDNKKPTASITATTTATPTNLINATNLALTVKATFSEAMNTGVAPTITFTPANAHLSAGAGVWSVGNTVYTIVYTHDGTAEEIASTTAKVNSGQDANGNVQIAAATSAAFKIDTQRPTVTSINRNSPAGQFTNGTSVSYTVVFSEATSGVTAADFTPTLVSTASGTPSAGSVTGVSTLDNITFTVSVGSIAGDGDIRLDVNASTATINDANSNALNVSHNGDQVYTIDMTPPTVTSIVIDPAIVNSYATSVNGTTPALHGNTFDYLITFNEKVSGLDGTFKDFNGIKSPNSGSIINVNPSSITPVSGSPDSQWKLNGTYTSGAGTFEIDFYPGANTVSTVQQGAGTIQAVNPGDQIINGIGTKFLSQIGGLYIIYDKNMDGVGFVGGVNTDTQLNTYSLADQAHPAGAYYFISANYLYAGTASTSTGSPTVTGTGTTFTNASVGDLVIEVSSFPYTLIGQVASITDNLTLTLTSNASANFVNSVNFYFIHKNPTTPFVSQIVDQAGNSLSTTFLGGGYGNFQKAQPAGGVTVFNSTPANKSITATWTDLPTADHYLVMLRNNAVVGTTPVGTFPAAGTVLKDGVYFADDTDLSDGLMILNINQGIQSATFSNLNSGASYSLIIYPYSLDNNNIVGGDHSAIDYNLTSPPTINNGTSTTTISSTTTVTKTSSSTTIPSITNASNGQAVFSFALNEDALATLATDDNSPFKFSTLVIKPGPSNALDWGANILGAQLTNNLNGAIVAGTVTAGTPTTCFMTFTPFSTASGAEGYVPDGGPAITYTLRIWLKTAVTDNTVLDFKVDNTSFTYDDASNNQASSRLAPASNATSGAVTITVTATALAFTQQPVLTPGTGLNQQYVLTPFTTDPKAKAVDVNGNVDVNYTGNPFKATITTAVNGPTLSTSTIIPSAGVYDFAGLQFLDAGTLTNVGTLTATVGGINSNSGAGANPCNTINVVYFGGTLFANGTSIAGSNAPATISSVGSSIPVFAFTVQDDGGVGGDGAATKITGFKFTPKSGQNQFANFQDLIASATLTDDSGIAGNTMTITQSASANGQINTGDLTFTALPIGATNLGSIGDNATKVYTLSITPKAGLTGGLQSTADNLRLVFEILDTNTTVNNTGSTLKTSPTQSATSDDAGHTNGKFDVQATQMVFSTQPSGNYLVSTALSGQSPIPVVEAEDTYGTRDLDFSASVTTTCFVGATSIGLSAQPTAFASGIINSTAFGAMSFTQIATGAALKIHTASIGTDAVSNTFNVKVGQASTLGSPVVVGAIPSTAFSSTAGTPAASTGPASVFQFKVTDDGAVTPNDGNPTLINQIVIKQNTTYNTQGTNSLQDWTQSIGGAVLSDGNAANDKVLDFSLPINAGYLTANSITFPSISFASGDLGYIPDSPNPPSNQNSKTYTLKIWLKPNLGGNLPIVIDGQTFGFDVQTFTDISVDPNGTDMFSGSAISSSGNTVNVVASKINYLALAPPTTPTVSFSQVSPSVISISNAPAFSVVPSPAFPSSAFIYTPFNDGATPTPNPTIGLEAVDANGNRDLGFAGTISAFSTVNSLTFANDPIATGNKTFANGTFSFDKNFQYTSANDQTAASKDGSISISTTGPSLSAQISTVINVSSSIDSYVYFDPNFAAQTFNNFVNQQASALPATANGTIAKMAQFIVSDGGAANFAVNATHAAISDADGGATNVTSLTFTVTSASGGVGDINKLALYDNSGNKISASDQSITLGSVNASGGYNTGTVTFSGLSISVADNSTATFSIQGTFKPTVFRDDDDIKFQVTGAAWGIQGSQVYPQTPTAGYIGGVFGGSVSPVNKVDVVATSLDFTVQPSGYAGVNEPVGNIPALVTLNAGSGYTDGTYYGVQLVKVSGTSTTAPIVDVTVSGGKITGLAKITGGQDNGTSTFDCPASAIGGTGSGFSVVLKTTPYSYGSTGSLTSMPSTFAGVVTARDVFANIDVDFNPSSITLSDAVGNNLTLPPVPTPSGRYFNDGIMDLNGMQYPAVAVGANGAIKITAGALTSPTTSSGNAIACQPVQVLDVSVTQDVTGVITASSSNPPGANLKGGTNANNIFGLKFTYNAKDVAEPKLKGFYIDFDVPYETATGKTFSGFVIKEVNHLGTNDITGPTIGGAWSKAASSTMPSGSYDRIFVDLSASPQSLGNESSKSISFFLYANVDANVNLSTPAITPSFTDKGYGFTSDQNSIVSNGTATGTFTGLKYSFASTNPPTLLTSSSSNTRPYLAQDNVDPYLSNVVLEFDANVGQFDMTYLNQPNGQIWDRTQNVKIADLIFDTSTTQHDLVTAAPYIQTYAAVQSNNTVNNVYKPMYYKVVYDSAGVGKGAGAQVLKYNTVYYVTLPKGNYDAPTGRGTGFTDFGLNFYGGISTSSGYYFKTSNNTPPVLNGIKSSFNTTNLGTLTTNFDQRGTAYFLILPTGSTTPTPAQVQGTATYTAAIPAAQGSYAITVVNADQTSTFPASFVSTQTYDVYIYAANDAIVNGGSSPKFAAGVYGSAANLFAAGASGPTYKIVPALISPALSSSNTPAVGSSNFVICPDAYSTITSPIIISETTTRSFAAPGTQDFNILLPVGYQFDRSVTPTIQLLATGASNDFGTSVAVPDYKSNTLLNISFSNGPANNSVDYIVVSGLSVIGASGSSQGTIQAFYGSNSFPNATFPLATVAVSTLTPVDFVNSYWQNNRALYNAIDPPINPDLSPNPSGQALDKTVNAIPDDYKDASGNNQVQLIPDPRTISQGDYLGSTFSGSGVTGDILTLSAVTVGASFKIEVQHADLNGCVTTKQEQYIVYDHRNTISNKLGAAFPSPSPLAGTQQAIPNINWPAASGSITPAAPLIDNELAGYTLQQLTVDLPADQVLASANTAPTQYMSGSAWRNWIQTAGIIAPPASPNPPHYQWTWDYKYLLNASPTIVNSTTFNGVASTSGLNDVYDYFKSPNPTPKKLYNYWLGGSLGKIEFTGIYNSTADGSVYNPFRQDVELFVPAVPVLEVASSNEMLPADTGDATTAVGGKTVQGLTTIPKTYPGGYPGTSIFCEAGGTIAINGYPTATAGVSGGVFQIYNYATYDFSGVSVPAGTITTATSSATVTGLGTTFDNTYVGGTLYDPYGNIIGEVLAYVSPTQLTLKANAKVALTTASAFRVNKNKPLTSATASGPFIDNGNGSMTLDPSVNNGYNDILVTYSFQLASSPAYGIGYLVIRITPNPVAKFTISSVAGASSISSTFDSFCAGNAVNFDANASTIATSSQGTSNTIATYAWNFSHPNSGAADRLSGAFGVAVPATNVQPGARPGQTFDKPSHVFDVSTAYPVSLTLTSNWGCTSAVVNDANPLHRTSTSDVLYQGSNGTITVGDKPVVDFDFSGNCMPSPIVFTDKSTVSGNSQTYQFTWYYDFPAKPTLFDVGYNQNQSSNTNQNPKVPASSVNGKTASHSYSAAGFYNVQLTTITTLGCQDSKQKYVSQLASTLPFSEYFDNANNGWQVVDLKKTPTPILPPPATASNEVSWSWGATSGRTISKYNTSNTVWSTSNVPAVTAGGKVFYDTLERSALYSPCFVMDPTLVPRPMISFSAFVNVASSDGMVLQYSNDNLNILDPAKVWTNLGDQGTGVDWYTAKGLSSNPGTSSSNAAGLGWSGNGVVGGTGSPAWIHPKHALDFLSSPTQPVMFRFAFASSKKNFQPGDAFDGVAIDSIFFGSRTRTILFEDFVTTDAGANTALNATIKDDNDYVRTFIQTYINSTQLVNINYHVGFVGQDPFNMDNTTEPGARSLFYGVKDVPYAFLDGHHHHAATGADSALFKNWGDAQYQLNTLKLAQANFNNSVVVNPDGSLTIDVNFTPLFNLRSGVGGATLQIAVLEKSISGSNVPTTYGKIATGETSFEYVLKKMLPNAVGTQFATPLLGPTAGPTPTSPPVYHPVSAGTFKYVPKNLHSKPVVLTVVVFLQDETTKDVYQADLIDNILVPAVVTGIEPTAENINIFPNPADQEVTIELPSPAKATTTVRLANQWGQFTEMTSFSEGEQKKTISTRDLAEGVYILQLGGNNNAVRAKVVVVHK